jgi:type IV secretion system protein VirB9
MWIQRLTVLLAFAAIEMAHAADGTNAASNDARVRIVTYMPNEVTVVRVQQGVVTRIILEPAEKIEIASVGMSSDCKREVDEWCISANPGSSQIFVRPRDNARENNMELHTNKRDYSFKFEVIETRVSRGKGTAPELPFFRVVFDYPKPP